jgi:hypothetical protein
VYERDSPKLNVFCAISWRKTYAPFLFVESTISGTLIWTCWRIGFSLTYRKTWTNTFSNKMALYLISIAKSTVTSVTSFHSAGLGELLLLNCSYATGLLGRRTSPHATFLWRYVKDTVNRPPPPHGLKELRRRIITAVTATEENLLEKVWQELHYRLHVSQAVWHRMPTLSVYNFKV